MENHQLPNQRAGTHSCPGCGALSRCDLELGKSRCWCFTEPKPKQVLPPEPGDKCLCRTCLKKAEKAGQLAIDATLEAV